jgi:K+/H+ antiporter YhaU regulatory subunit KhtT
LILEDRDTEVLVGDKAQGENLAAHINSRAIKIKHQIKKLGVILDYEFNLASHTRNVTKIALYHPRNIAKVRPFLSQADTERLIHAFITIRLA